MSTKLGNDPIGNAVYNYHFNNNNSPITVTSTVVEDEDLPPDYFFRKYNDMPLLERLALKQCKGKVLDVGSGAGCHALFLQQKGIDVTALELSEKCCEVMTDIGIKNVVNSNILAHKNKQYDTILLLMNGIGIAGTTKGLGELLIHLKTLLASNGKIILDSSDLMYLFEQEDGTILFDLNAENYYGEIEYQLKYGSIKGESFSWLFADHVILSEIAELIGFKTKILEYGPHYDYLAELTIL